MGRINAYLLALAMGVAIAFGLASCGSGGGADLLPGTTADEINSNLDQVEQLVAENECVGAENTVASVISQVEELQGVDPRLQSALREGATRLSEVVAACEEAEVEETEPTVETAVEPEEVEEEGDKKEKKEKKGRKEAEQPRQEAGEADEGPTTPPQSNGKGEEKGQGKGKEEAPPAEAPESPPSGGLGPSTPAEGE